MPRALLPSTESERLAALRSHLVLDTTFEATLNNLARLAARLTGCPTALVSLVDADRQWFKAHHGMVLLRTPCELAFCAHAMLDPSGPLVVPDATADARFADNPLVAGEPGIRFYAGIPLVNTDGHALGTICVIDYVPKEIGFDALDLLSDLARAAMPMIEQHNAIKLLRMTAKRAEDRFTSVIEAMPAALVLSDRAGEIRIVNRQAEEMFGYAPAELVGKPLELLLPERFRQRHIGLRQEFLNTSSSRTIGQGETLFGLRRDGTEFPLEIGLSLVDPDGEPMPLAAIVDVSTRYQLELERQRELERSNADLQEFAYAASHDLKAPLRAIAHLAEWIRGDIEPIATSDTMDNLKLLQARVARLQMLLAGLLEYSRAGRIDVADEDVDIADVVCGVAAMLELPAGFEVVCEGSMPVVRTHRTPIELVFKHLIGNGFRHHDRSRGRITVAMRLLDNIVEFRVSDDGPGIPERFHDRIFMIFQTLQPRDNIESAGLGLAIVKKLIENNGGQISVESDSLTRGATFVFAWKIIHNDRD